MDTAAVISVINLVMVLGLFIFIATRKSGSGLDIAKDLQMQRTELREQLNSNNEATLRSLETIRTVNENSATKQREEFTASRTELQQNLAQALTNIETKISELTDSNARKQQELTETVRSEIEKLRQGNEEKLEKMRETVDEKLQGTLERRLTESFSLVNERLEAVQRGLGEMQNLASDVGGLQKVLTNVKNRGGWGEVQLERQLEDIFAPNQYEKNVKLRNDSREVVEFAVKFPGRTEGEHVYLPIDSKFPQEDYERLLNAQESGSVEEIASCSKNLEAAIKAQAKKISEKYINPPVTTDIAILYLPTEGLFAEVVRRPGLTSELQSTYRVLVTGPTTLMSLLNSFQMGFKTLAIEKSASEVWQVLAATKVAFGQYGDVMEKLAKQLETAQNTVREVGTKTRKVNKTLTKVESTYELPNNSGVLGLPLLEESEDQQ